MQEYEDDFRSAMQTVNMSFLGPRSRTSPDPLLAPSDPIPQPSWSTYNLDAMESCTCVDQQVKFLSKLRKFEGKYPLSLVPVILQATQESRTLWERLTHCHLCRRDQDSVAVLIFAMGLRNILRALQCLIKSQQSASQRFTHSNQWGQHSSESISSSLGGISTHSGGISSRGSSFDSLGAGGINQGLASLTTNTIRVGSFEIPHDEQAFLTDVLIARTLSKIKMTYESMVEYIERMQATLFSTLVPGEKRPVHMVLEDLQRLLLVTEGLVREIIHR